MVFKELSFPFEEDADSDTSEDLFTSQQSFKETGVQ